MSSMLDEQNGLIHIVTKTEDVRLPQPHVDVVRVSDGHVVSRMEGQTLWVGSLEGQTRVFVLAAERGSVVEIDPKRGNPVRSWSGAEGVVPGLSRVEGGALVVQLGTPFTWEPNGMPLADRPPPAPPPEPRHMFVPLDREGAVSFHHGALPTSDAATPAFAEVRTEEGKLWLRPAGGAAPVLLLDPAPPGGFTPAMYVDAREVVLIVVDSTSSTATWQVRDAVTGALRAQVPRDGCNGPPRVVGELIVCEREGQKSTRQEIVAMDARTLEARWTHAAMSLPMPTPYSASGAPPAPAAR